MDTEHFDVVVVGTGAAGLTAAVRAADDGARVGLFEKADTVGGTTAWSGGMVWIPNNPQMTEMGIPDSREAALTYLASLSNGMIDDGLAAAFVDTGPEMVEWLAANTPVTFSAIAGFPDYHPEHAGGRPNGGRSLECPLFPFNELGPWAARVTVGYQLKGNITMSETPLGRGAPDGVPPAELARRQIADERGAGQGLIGRLLRACLDRGVVPRTGMRAERLLTTEGIVTGVEFSSATGRCQVHATGGVVLATGGFEWDDDLVRTFLRGPMIRPVSVPTNTGDGLRMVMRIGAELGNMREAWWVPTIDVSHPDRGWVAWQVNGERSRPHCIMVNDLGRRFTNEAASYNAFGAAFHVIEPNTFEYTNHPCWMIFDHHYLTRYGLAGYRAQGPLPDGIFQAASIEELAAVTNLPAAELVATVARWNANALTGEDPDFGRGQSVYDRWWGDPQFKGSPASTIGPLERAPFYAVRVRSGTLGTKGGPRTDAEARVLDVDGHPIYGLYAAGNVMASCMGMAYGGGGGTLGPAMVFGYLAGRHAAGRDARSTLSTQRRA
ncbi:MAG TPA: FAD-dependent oxidoreductase [Kineosporiaceae bacterium]|nr:FAD-dependent oxidoreductase [Kineosporiaceae bacterium]